jgi:hypothetical protein
MATIKNKELKATLDMYSADLKAMAKIRPRQFDIVTVATLISSVPERKWNAAQGVVNNTLLKKDADNQLKGLKGRLMFQASNMKDMKGLSSAQDRAGWVDSRPEVKTAEIDALNAEAELLAAKLAYECLDDMFSAGKRVMQWLIAQDRDTRDYEKFANEGKRHGVKPMQQTG